MKRWGAITLVVLISLFSLGTILSCGGGSSSNNTNINTNIPTGCFDMGDAFAEGDADELPVHNVCISGFNMDEHEVTNGEYADCVAAGGCDPPSFSTSFSRLTYYGNVAYDDFPVIWVDWDQANAYCSWVGKRLPTEAEWEYAARGGFASKRYPWGDTITGTDANYQNSGDAWDNDTSPVMNYAANGYGLYDMAGNVWEWVSDWHDVGYYSVSPIDNPQGPALGSTHAARGGAWDQPVIDLRVSNRGSLGTGSNYLGFRCAWD